MALLLALLLALGQPAPWRPAEARRAPEAVIVAPHATAAPQRPSRAVLRGTASWGYGWSGVVTRLPRGTRICVAGPLGSWCGRSEGYGPAASTGRVADLSRPVFARVCGDPSRGLCRVSLTW